MFHTHKICVYFESKELSNLVTICHYVPTWFDRHGLLMLPWNLKKKRRQRCEWRRRQIPLPESLVQMLDQQLPMGMQIQ